MSPPLAARLLCAIVVALAILPAGHGCVRGEDRSPVPPVPTRAIATVHGAAGEVGGSLAVLDTGNGRWMIDCGDRMLEWSDPSDDRDGSSPDPADDLPVDPRSIAAVFITRAHTDHVGRLPLLAEGGFRGPIYLTEATAELLPIMLRMEIRYSAGRTREWAWSKASLERAKSAGQAATVHWRPDCRYRNSIAVENLAQADCTLSALESRFRKTGAPIKLRLCQRCTEDEVDAIVSLCRRVRFQQPVQAAPGVRATFLYAGHIPGSASVLFDVAVGNATRRALFSGDVGNDLSPLFAGPQPAPDVDAVFVEATYGDTFRDRSVGKERAEFRRAVADAVGRGRIVWVPVFALDRTQRILHELRVAQQEGLLPAGVPIYCPSSTAREITETYRQHRQDGWFRDPVAGDRWAWSPDGLRHSGSLPKELPRPCILLTTSGMLDHGLSRKFFDQLVPDGSTTILLVGYQEPASPGGRLMQAVGLAAPGTRNQAGLAPGAADRSPPAARNASAAPVVEADGRRLPVRASVRYFRCFSAHGDSKDLDAWLDRIRRDAAVVLVHGGPEELSTRAAQLRRQGWTNVTVAQPGQPIDLAGR